MLGGLCLGWQILILLLRRRAHRRGIRFKGFTADEASQSSAVVDHKVPVASRARQVTTRLLRARAYSISAIRRMRITKFVRK
jgi:hypothetical protein